MGRIEKLGSRGFSRQQFLKLAGSGVAGAAVLGLSGCGGGGGQGGESGLTVWKFGSPQGERDYISEMHEMFDENNENIEASLEFFDYEEISQRIATANNSDNLPDIVVVENTTVPDLAEQGIIVPVGGQEANEWEEYYVPALWDSGIYEDELYGICTYSELSPMLLYNTEMFEANGLEPPTSWSELVDLAERLNTDGVYGVAFGASDVLDIDIIEGIGYVNGARWIDESTGEVAIGGDGMIDALRLLKDLQPYAPEGLTDLNFRDTLQLFFQEQAAMVITKSFAPIIQADYDVPEDFPGDLVLFPKPDNKSGEFSSASFVAQGQNFFAVTRQANMEQAIEYVDFWAQPEQQQGWDGSRIPGRVPATTALLESEGFAEQYPSLAELYEEGSLFEDAVPSPAFVGKTQVRDGLRIAVQEVVTDTSTPEEAVGTLAENARNEIG